MTSVSNARKLATWHAIVLTLDALIATIMDTLQWIALTKYHLQAHWHDAEITPLADMTDQHLRIIATPGVPTMTIETGTDSVNPDISHINPDITELIFGINIQKKFSLSYAWDKDKNCYIQWNGKFLVYIHSCNHTATIGTVKSPLKIPPRHNGVISIKISGPIIKTHMAYFLTDDSIPKGKDLNINIIDGIHKIKGKTSVNILVSNYTNKDLTFHEGEYIGHLKPAVLDSTDQQETHQTNSVTLKKMKSETVTPDTFNPPHHELSASVQDNLKLSLQEYESQFAKDETTIGTTPLTSMTIDTGTSDPVSPKPYHIAIKHYQWVKEEIEKLLAAKVICTSCSIWSAPIIVVPKGDGGKCLVIDYRALNKVTRKFT